MKHMQLADSIRRAYHGRQAAKSAEGGWVKWAQAYPQLNDLLMYAERLTEERDQ